MPALHFAKTRRRWAWVWCAIAVLCTVVAPLQSLPAGPYITVAWDSSPDERVVGYVVYVGTLPGRYNEAFVTEIGRSSRIRMPFLAARTTLRLLHMQGGRSWAVHRQKYRDMGKQLQLSFHLTISASALSRLHRRAPRAVQTRRSRLVIPLTPQSFPPKAP